MVFGVILFQIKCLNIIQQTILPMPYLYHTTILLILRYHWFQLIIFDIFTSYLLIQQKETFNYFLIKKKFVQANLLLSVPFSLTI